MSIEQPRFQDIELLSAKSPAELTDLLKPRLLNGWDLFGGVKVDGGLWVQYVVLRRVKEWTPSSGNPRAKKAA